MAKPRFVVNQEVLTEIVNTLEIGGGMTNRNTLYKAAEKLYNTANPNATISSSVIGLRIKEYGMTLKTPIGKRGRPRKDSGAVTVIVSDISNQNTEMPVETVPVSVQEISNEASPVEVETQEAVLV